MAPWRPEHCDPTATTSPAGPGSSPTVSSVPQVRSDMQDLCFLVSPIGEDGSATRAYADTVRDAIVRPAARANGLQTVRADEITSPGNINDQVVEHLLHARLVVADLTELNPNVFYELAVRHSFGLPAVHIARRGERLPFDLATERVLWLDVEGLEAVRRYPQMVDGLGQMMNAALSVSHWNPVTRVVDASSLAERSEVPGIDRLEQALVDMRDVLDPTPVLSELIQASAELRRLGALLDSGTWNAEERPRPADLADLDRSRKHIEEVLRARRVRVDAQPVADVRADAWVGVELLPRLIGADGKVLSPPDWVPIAEAFGLGAEISLQVLAQVPEVIERLGPSKARAELNAPFFIALNCSRGELRSPSFRSALLDAGHVVARGRNLRLVVEVQEHQLSLVEGIETLQPLQDAGIGITVDDYGAGFSSMAMLKRTPADAIKIDRSIVNSVDLADREVLTSAIIAIGGSLGLTVMADCVETAHRSAELAAMGCVVQQGYALSMPLGLRQLTSVLFNHPTSEMKLHPR